MAQMDMFTPVVFQDAVLCPFVVGVGDGIGGLVFTGGVEIGNQGDAIARLTTKTRIRVGVIAI